MRDKHHVMMVWLSTVLLILAGCAGNDTRSHGPAAYSTYSDSDWEQHRAENVKAATSTMASAMKGEKARLPGEKAILPGEKAILPGEKAILPGEKPAKQATVVLKETTKPAAGPLQLSIEDALKLARTRNQDVQTAEMEVEKARGEVMSAYSAVLPTLSLSGGYTRLGSVPEFEVSPGVFVEMGRADNYRAGLTLNQPLYLGGKGRAALKIAKLYKHLSESGLKGAHTATAMAVRQAYYGLLHAQEVVGSTTAQVTMARGHLADVEIKRAEGSALALHVMRARSGLSLAESGLIKTKADYETARRLLLKSLDLPLDTEVVLTSTYPDKPAAINVEDAMATALANRPDYVAALDSISLQEQNLTIVKAGYKPNLIAFGDFTYTKPDSNLIGSNDWGDSWDAGARVSWTLFDGFNTRGQMIKERAELRRLQIERDKLLLTIRSDVEDAVAGLTSANDLVRARAVNLAEAEETLRLAKESYEAGAATQLDVLDAETGLVEASLAMADARYVLGVAQAAYLAGIGLTDLPTRPAEEE